MTDGRTDGQTDRQNSYINIARQLCYADACLKSALLDWWNVLTRRGTEWAKIQHELQEVGGDLTRYYWFAKTTHSITADAVVDTIAPKWISRDRFVEILTVRRRCRRLGSQPSASLPPRSPLSSYHLVITPSSPAASFSACLSTSSSSFLKRLDGREDERQKVDAVRL